MSNISIFEYLDYRKFLSDLIKSRPNQGRGERKNLAKVLNCQMAFLTHVFNGEKDFGHENMFKIAEYFHLNVDEQEYLLMMLSYNRAGTNELKSFYKSKLLLKKEQYNLLKNRLQENQNLGIEDQARYYSHWLYGAVHMAATVPKLQSVTKISEYFDVKETDLKDILEFLAAKGLIILESGKVLPGNAHLYVPSDSPLVNQNHTIWRMKALNDLKTNKSDDLHYSLCFSASEKDWPILREKMLEAINDCLKVIRPSKEEKLGLLCVDFQEV